MGEEPSTFLNPFFPIFTLVALRCPDVGASSVAVAVAVDVAIVAVVAIVAAAAQSQTVLGV